MKQVIPFYKEIVFKTNIASITSISLEHEEKVLEGEISGNFIVFGKYKVHNDTTEEIDFKYKLPFTTLIPDDIDKDSIVVDIENFTFDQIEEDVLRIDIDFTIEGDVLENTECHDEEIDKIDREIDEILGIDEECDDIEDIGSDTKEETEEVVSEVEVLDLEDIREDSEVEENEVEDLEETIIERDDMVVNEINNVINPTIFTGTTNMLNDNVGKAEDQEMNIIPDMNIITKNTVVEEKKEESEYVTYHVHLVKENETIEQIISMYNVSVDYLKEYNEITEIKVGDKLIIPEYGDE